MVGRGSVQCRQGEGGIAVAGSGGGSRQEQAGEEREGEAGRKGRESRQVGEVAATAGR